MASKVLVVDDSRVVRTMAGDALQAAGFPVLEACDGVEALALLDASSDIAVVVSDMNMPRMTGLELLEVVAARPGPRASVIILTTESEMLFVQRARDLGAKGWLFKPLRTELLVAAVTRIISRERPTTVAVAARVRAIE
jgi:two-component system chemotaxis response regulator CheY